MLPRAEVRGRGVRRWDVAPEDTVRLGVGGVVEDDAVQIGRWTRRSHPPAHRHRHLDRALLADAGIPVVDSPIVTRRRRHRARSSSPTTSAIAGVPDREHPGAAVLDQPWQTYQYLTQVSQIPAGERLRSDSASYPGCIWGFPSYGVREAWREKTLAPLWSAVTEPIFTDYWTPQGRPGLRGHPTRSRPDLVVGLRGQGTGADGAQAGRRRVLHDLHATRRARAPTKRVAYRSTYVHLAVGYPGLKFLPDLQEYRQRHPDSGQRRERLRAPRARVPAAAAPARRGDGPRQRHRRRPGSCNA